MTPNKLPRIRPMRPGSAHEHFSGGFTLIELMIVVAIVAILAAIAYPSYRDSVLKGRRAEGRTAVLDLLQQQERYFTQSNAYLSFAAGAAGVPFKTFSGSDPTSGSYKLGARLCTPTPAPPTPLTLRECVEVFADPAAVGSDPQANELLARSTGDKGCNGTKPTVCWK